MTTSEAKAGGAHKARGVFRLIAAGFNGHRQLLDMESDVRVFRTMEGPVFNTAPRILFAGWSTTVIVSGRELFSLGFQRLNATTKLYKNLRSAFGDHDGIRGCLDDRGHLYLAKQIRDPGLGYDLSCVGSGQSPLISNIAQAQNERIVLTLQRTLSSRFCRVLEFDSLTALVKWFANPKDEIDIPEKHSMLLGNPKQLVANAASFILLMDDGAVYTWGDSRYGSLGRPITGDGATPANQPGLVESLGGLNVCKIASGGWMSAALTEDSALYLWGAPSPSNVGCLTCLAALQPGELALVDLLREDSEPMDIVDVAVGNGHVAAVTSDHRLFVVGHNKSGQLGLGKLDEFFEDWQEVKSSPHAQQVFAGPDSTFAVVAV